MVVSPRLFRAPVAGMLNGSVPERRLLTQDALIEPVWNTKLLDKLFAQNFPLVLHCIPLEVRLPLSFSPPVAAGLSIEPWAALPAAIVGALPTAPPLPELLGLLSSLALLLPAVLFVSLQHHHGSCCCLLLVRRHCC